MRTVWIFGHQLSMKWSVLAELNKQEDRILLVEARSRGEWRPYHKQKLIFVYAAMRHYAHDLRKLGFHVDYRQSDTFEQGFNAHVADYEPVHVIVHLPTEWKMRQRVQRWAIQQQQAEHIQVEVRSEDEIFLVPESEWSQLLPMNKKWNLEQVYRKLRVRFNILMDGKQPVGGKWNYDADNRKGPDEHAKFTPALVFTSDETLEQVIHEVETNYSHHPGESSPFIWPVSSAQAEIALTHFLAYRLATFGTYQDAMRVTDPFMSHSLLASLFNFGLLDPLEVIHRAEMCYREGKAPLQAVEGFIRQILGWREYVRGVYLLQMPDYAQMNEFQHHRALPAFYWHADTRMNCVKQAVTDVNQFAYSHHIQRLMILCNFANLAGISPQAVSDWFNEMYIDALDWVVVPNVLGMGLYADGGIMSTKPYVSSGQYIHRMSDACETCSYEVKFKLGEKACPFHALYWAFIDRNVDKLKRNPRMTMMVSSWQKMNTASRLELLQQAEFVLQRLDEGRL